MRSAVVVRTLLALALIWGVVWVVRAVAGSFKTTAAGIERKVEAAGFAGGSATAAVREGKLREIAAMINRLDYQERVAHRRLGTAARLFETLNPAEQELFVELTVTPALESLLDSMEALPAKQRKRFIDQGTKEIAANPAEPQMAAGYQRSLKMLENVDIKDLRAGLKAAGPRTKMQLAPLAEAINEALQGMNGPEFGPRRQP